MTRLALATLILIAIIALGLTHEPGVTELHDTGNYGRNG